MKNKLLNRLNRCIWILLLSSFALIISTPLKAREKSRVAVMPFKAGSGVSRAEASYLADKVRTGLIKTGAFEVISNDQIQSMMQLKQSKQQMGRGSCTSEKCIIDLGNALECEKMIVGTAAGAFNQYSINVKMLDVVKQNYEFGEDITIKSKDDFPQAAEKIVHLLMESMEQNGYLAGTGFRGRVNFPGMLWRSVLVPGWGHFYANQKRGYVYGALWLGIGSAFLWSHFNYTSKQEDYRNASSDFKTKYDLSTSAYQLRGYLSFAFLGVYVATLSDMLITGNGYTPSHGETASADVQWNIIFGSSARDPRFGGPNDDRMEIVFSRSF